MRLMLDAHISGNKVGEPLSRAGHDVRSVDTEASLEGKSDEDLLAIAAADSRVFVTFDAGDFAKISTVWAEAKRSHSGCVILVGMSNDKFGVILRSLEAAFRVRAESRDWKNRTAFVGPLT